MEEINENKPLKKEVLLKNKHCASIMGALYKGEFFLCNYISEFNYILCQYCVQTCHKGHEHSTFSKGNYQCFCGRDLHCRALDKNPTKEYNCIYQEIFKETPNEGFFFVRDPSTKELSTYCFICLTKCMNMTSKEKVVKKEDEKCECPHHETFNALLISQDFKKHSKANKTSKNFNFYLKNFNFNLMFKNEKISEVTTKILYKTLMDPNHNRNETLQNPNIQAIIELFSVFSIKWKNKFFYAEQFKKDVFREICNLISEKPQLSLSREEQYKHFKNQIYWTNFLFSCLIRGNYISKYNLWSLATIQNMNIYQRYKYIFGIDTSRSKAFLKRDNLTKEKEQFLITLLLDLFEKIIQKYDEVLDIEKVYHEIFPLVNKMMKFVLKYYLVTKEQARKYFELVHEIIRKTNDLEMSEQSTKKAYSIKQKSASRLINETKLLDKKNIVDTGEHQEHEVQAEGREEDEEEGKVDDFYKISLISPLLINKAIFYYLLYLNDEYVYKLMISNSMTEPRFIFTEQSTMTETKTIEDIKFIFYHILLKPKVCEIDKDSLISVQTKILSFMTQKKENCYVNMMNNIKLLPEVKNVNPIIDSYDKAINSFATQLRTLSREYFTYKIQYIEYANKVDKIIDEFKEYVKNTIGLDDLSTSFLNFIKKNNNEKEKQEITNFQLAAKNSLLFQALEELIQISGFACDYIFKHNKSLEADKSKDQGGKSKSQVKGKGKEKEKESDVKPIIEPKESHEELALTPTKESRLFILQLYYLLISNDHENLCLFMNIKPKPFVNFFNYIDQDFLEFYYRFIEILYSSPYYYADIKFITFTFNFYSEIIKTSRDNYTKIAGFFDLLNLLLKKDSKLNLIQLGKVLDKYFPIKKISELKEIIESYLTNKPKNFNESTKEKVSELFRSFFEALSTYESLDLSQYIRLEKMTLDVINDPKTLNVPAILDTFLSNQAHEKNIDIKILYPLLKLYIQRELPFRLQLSNDNENMMAYLLDELAIPPNAFGHLQLASKVTKISNTSLINICRSKEGSFSQSDQLKQQIAKLIQTMSFITKIAENYDKLFVQFVNSPKSFKSLFHMKIEAYKFMQNILIKPSYYVTKAIEIYLPYIEGIQFEHLQKLVFNLLKAIEFFYSNINSFDKAEEDKYKGLYSLEEFKRYIQLEIQLNLSQKELDELHQSIISISQIKFFKVKEYMKQYEDVLLKIFILESPFMLIPNNKEEKKIDTIISIYEEKLSQGSEFVNCSSKFITCEALESEYFKIISKTKSLTFHIEHLERIQFFINLMESISDFKNFQKQDQKDKVAAILKKYVDETLIHQFLTVICFSNINEIARQFNLTSMNEMKRMSVNTYVNTVLTSFFQILCEGNNTVMKDYLFHAKAIVDVQKNKALEGIRRVNKKTSKQDSIESKRGSMDLVATPADKKGWDSLKKSSPDNVISKDSETNEPPSRKSPMKSRGIQAYKTGLVSDNGKEKNEDKAVDLYASSNSINMNPNIVNVMGEVTQKTRQERMRQRTLIQTPQIEDRNVSLLNIIFTNMKMIQARYKENDQMSLTSRIYEKIKIYLHSNTNQLNAGYRNLVIEMIQGYDFKNEDPFSKPAKINRISPFGFYYLCQEMLGLINLEKRELDLSIIDVKIDLITIILNIAKQKINLLNANFHTHFSHMDLNAKLVYYMKYIYLFYCGLLDPNDNQAFTNHMKDIQFTDAMLKEMIEKYKRDWTIYQNKYFQLSQCLYFFIRLLHEKFRNLNVGIWINNSQKNFDEAAKEEFERINKLRADWMQNKQDQDKADTLKKGETENSTMKNRETEGKRKGRSKEKDQEQSLKKSKAIQSQEIDFKSAGDDQEGRKSKVMPLSARSEEGGESKRRPSVSSQGPTQVDQKDKKKKNEKSLFEKNILSRIFALKFFNKIIKTIEISQTDEESTETKKVSFIIEPKTYVVNDNEIEKLFDKVDRSTRRTKLSSIINVLEVIVNKIKYKAEHKQNEKWLWLTEFDYSWIDLFNCIFVIIIFFTLLLMLEQSQAADVILLSVSLYMEIILIVVNVVALTVFLFTKYSMYVHLNTLKWMKERPNDNVVKMMIHVYLLDSFLLNDEVNKMIIMSVFGYLGIATNYDIILFTFQLLTLGSFIPTIKDIFDAFISRFTQLVSMIVFLGIFTFAFANYDYYFLSDQFILEQEGGVMMNTCSSLLECYITLFNNGVRSGGGIGDVLGEADYSARGYFERWLHDMIFFFVIILLLLNMINGVIVSTFSQIREDSTQKEEDMNNICFICSIPVYELKKKKNTFLNHYKNDHNVKTYVRYLTHLYLIDDQDMDQDQYYVFNCIENKSLEFFPYYKNDSNDEDEDEDDN